MALISDIRKRMWIVVILIALAMFGFLLQDATSSRGFLRGGKETVGSVNGTKVKIRDFEKEVKTFSEQNKQASYFANVDMAWREYVTRSLFQQEAEKLGLDVSSAEVEDQMSGPGVMQNRRLYSFLGKYFGQVNPMEMDSLTNLLQTRGTEEVKKELQDLRVGLKDDILKTKFVALFAKGFYTPTWLVQSEYALRNTAMDAAYVFVPVSSIPDDQASVTDEELNQYIKEHKDDFSEDPTANIEFVTFDVKPSAADTLALRTELEKLIPGFAAKTKASDDSLYIAENMGTPFDGKWMSAEDLTGSPVIDSLFAAPIGKVVGPYLEGSELAITKVINRRSVPDSVDYRHILRFAKNPTEVTAAKSYLDSIKVLIETGKMTFEMAAAQHSEDQGSKTQGGRYPQYQDLKGINNMMPSFRDYVLFDGAVGTLGYVYTPYGVHLMQVTKRQSSGKMSVQTGSIKRPMIPSKATESARYQEAVAFIGDNRDLASFRKAAEARKLPIQKGNNLPLNGYQIQGLEQQNAARDIIKWANKDAAVGQVSKQPYTFENQEYNYPNLHVVAAVVSKKGEGLPRLDDVRDVVTPLVRNKKKLEVIKSRIQSTDLSSVANTFAANVDTVRNASLAQAQNNPQLSAEPAFWGAARKLNNGETSKPVVGRNGVFVVSLLNKVDAQAPDLAMARRTVASKAKRAFSNQNIITEALKKSANVKDYRSDFY